MTEHDDLDRQFISFAPTQAEQLEHPYEDQIKERQGHHPSSPPAQLGGRSTWMRFSAPARSGRHPVSWLVTEMRLLSWNVNVARAKYRDHWLGLWRSFEWDVIALQGKASINCLNSRGST